MKIRLSDIIRQHETGLRRRLSAKAQQPTATDFVEANTNMNVYADANDDIQAAKYEN